MDARLNDLFGEFKKAGVDMGDYSMETNKSVNQPTFFNTYCNDVLAKKSNPFAPDLRPITRLVCDILKDFVLFAIAATALAYVFTQMPPLSAAVFGGLISLTYDISRFALEKLGINLHVFGPICLAITPIAVAVLAPFALSFLGLPSLGSLGIGNCFVFSITIVSVSMALEIPLNVVLKNIGIQPIYISNSSKS